MIVIVAFCVSISHPQNFLNLILIFTNFSFFILRTFVLIKKREIPLAVITVHGLVNKQLQLLRVEAQKWPKIKQVVSIGHAQVVPRLKQVRLKVTSQQATLLIDEY